MSNKFYAVFVESSVHIPGDERSKQCPGHGYPAHTHKYTEVIEFESEEKLKDWIKREEGRYSNPRKYRVMLCTPIGVSTKLNVEIKLP